MLLRLVFRIVFLKLPVSTHWIFLCVATVFGIVNVHCYPLKYADDTALLPEAVLKEDLIEISKIIIKKYKHSCIGLQENTKTTNKFQTR